MCLTMGKYIKMNNFGNLKSHDYHVLMKQFLPLGGRLQMDVKKISRIFRQICNKVWNPSEIESFIVNVVISFVLMEMHFPPSFFDIMIHLLYHFMDELDMWTNGH